MSQIIIIGASGFVGQQIMPNLRASKYGKVIAVGRDASKLATLYPPSEYPDVTHTDYDGLAEIIGDGDIMVHMATVNNDQNHDNMHAINVGLTKKLIAIAQQKDDVHFIFLSSFHAFSHDSDYAQSKRDAEALFSTDISHSIINLPIVYGKDWPRSLGFLRAMPKLLAKIIFNALSSLKPAAHADQISAFILAAKQGERVQGRVLISNKQNGNIFYHSVKKIIDISGALAGIIVTILLFLPLAIAIRKDSPGPIIFKQLRVGRGGKNFTCYKFRTMYVDTKDMPTHNATSVSVTKVGAFLRRTKLDELPQLWNVLFGQMSMVGPRPCLPVQNELIHERDIREVLTMTPGITGLAQVRGVDMSDPKRLAILDAHYLAQRSTLLDIKLLIQTIKGGGSGDKVKTA